MNKNLSFEKLIIEFNSGIKIGSQSYFANKSKIPTQNISAWINGRSVPTRDNIIQIAKILKKDITEIQAIFNDKSNKYENNNSSIIDLILEKIKRLETENALLRKEIELIKTKTEKK